MNAVAIGPFAFSADRFSVIAGLIVFMLVGSLLAARVDNRLGTLRQLRRFSELPARGRGMCSSMPRASCRSRCVFSPFGRAAFPRQGPPRRSPRGRAALAKAPKAAPWAILPLAAGFFVWVVVTTLTDSGAAPRAPGTSYAVLARDETLSIADRKADRRFSISGQAGVHPAGGKCR